jgi:hypothetical protein
MEELVQIELDTGAEEFFAEPANPRRKAPKHTVICLRRARI